MILRALAAAAASLVLASSAAADVVSPKDVKIDEDNKIEKSLSGVAGDAKKGRQWFANRKLGNCLACHKNSDLNELTFHGEVGPEMDGVADRYTAAELRAIVVNSKKIFGEESIMPGFYTLALGDRIADKFAGKTILTAQQVEDIVAYLTTLKEK